MEIHFCQDSASHMQGNYTNSLDRTVRFTSILRAVSTEQGAPAVAKPMA